MLIGCYYDKLNRHYVIFSLPYGLSDYFMTTTDIMHTQFNQTGYHLNDLVPMLFAKPHRVSIQIGQNEKLSSSFVTLLKQGTFRGKQFLIASYQQLFLYKVKLFLKIGHRIHIQPRGCYRLEQDENNMLPFDEFILTPYYNSQKSKYIYKFLSILYKTSNCSFQIYFSWWGKFHDYNTY
jgi:hypothetical protein